MNSLFWSRAHGAATHFPIALVLGAAFFDLLAFLLPRSRKRRDFRAIGYWLVILAPHGFSARSSPAWRSRIGRLPWTGLILRHHLFVWPAFTLIVGAATWRFVVGREPSRRGFGIYLCAMVLACMLIGAAGFFGGELLLGQ